MAKSNGNGTRSHDEQVEILRGIWNQMKALNGRIDKTNERLDGTNERLDGTNERLNGTNERLEALSRRVVQSEERLTTITSQLSTDVQSLTGLIREWRQEHREDRAEIKLRLERLETHVGIGRHT
jgi:predicted  nucleic acid-binding Zn-ribbon protein